MGTKSRSNYSLGLSLTQEKFDSIFKKEVMVEIPDLPERCRICPATGFGVYKPRQMNCFGCQRKSYYDGVPK